MKILHLIETFALESKLDYLAWCSVYGIPSNDTGLIGAGNSARQRVIRYIWNRNHLRKHFNDIWAD